MTTGPWNIHLLDVTRISEDCMLLEYPRTAGPWDTHILDATRIYGDYMILEFPRTT
jgi:hypothetical protein